jgi:cytochrome c5
MKRRVIGAGLALAVLAGTAGAEEPGEKTYTALCAVCHQAGIAGAPKTEDAAEWAARAKQGVDTLYKHALEGYTGAKGVMPPKGGNPSLPDAEVKAAVDYMLRRTAR